MIYCRLITSLPQSCGKLQFPTYRLFHCFQRSHASRRCPMILLDRQKNGPLLVRLCAALCNNFLGNHPTNMTISHPSRASIQFHIQPIHLRLFPPFYLDQKNIKTRTDPFSTKSILSSQDTIDGINSKVGATVHFQAE